MPRRKQAAPPKPPENGIVTIPYNYTPRDYQLPVLSGLDNGIKRAALVWHRRSGKDKTALNFMIKSMVPWAGNPVGRIGMYYYFFPTFNQGRKILWDGIDDKGRRYISHFPASLVAEKNEAEMQVTLKNGSLFQIIGTDKIDNIVGTNPVGCVFSEYSLQNPRAWKLISPILKENGGWAVFIYTPRGKNHGWRLYDMARKMPGFWFTQLLTIRDTKREDGTPVITEESVDQERKEGMDEETIQQEYYCSFTGSVEGTYFGKLLDIADRENRITNVPWEPSLPVNTWWDLGVGDDTAIWFTQHIHNEVRVIEAIAGTGEGLPFWIRELQTRPYVYGEHWAPHDIRVREFGSGKARIQAAAALGIRFKVTNKLDLDDGIDATRRAIPRCWFDRGKCEDGLDALRNYHKEYDEVKECFSNTPVHDWSSHYADAFRTFAVGCRMSSSAPTVAVRAVIAFDPFNYDNPTTAETEFDPYNY